MDSVNGDKVQKKIVLHTISHEGVLATDESFNSWRKPVTVFASVLGNVSSGLSLKKCSLTSKQ
jgi:hypothetical protein